MSGAFAIRMDLGGLQATLDAEREKIADAVRPAAQAGAQVLYEAVLRNAQALGGKTGNLVSGIYQAYSANNSEAGKSATYHVSWNARKAPHGHLVEFGYVKKYVSYQGKDGRWYTAKKNGQPVPLPGGPRQVAGKAFVRRAQAQFDVAGDVMTAEFLRRIGGADGH